MNEVEEKMLQTPIEIVLGIDEEGMTTAKKLYDFLEMDKSHYSRWVKANIVDNKFATENEDYFYSPSMANENSRGNFADDYRLTAHFAKKLSMKGNGERAEQAREYFAKLEEKVKQKAIDLSQLSPELQMFQKIFNSVAQQQLEQKRQAKKLDHVEQRVESIREVVAMDTTSWRDDTGNILRKIGMELGGGQVIVRDGKVAAEVAYPICGLLSDLPLEELAEKKKELNRVAHEMGTEIAIPFMFLSFICLAAIPAYAITDCGFIDVVQQKVIDPILEVVE